MRKDRMIQIVLRMLSYGVFTVILSIFVLIIFEGVKSFSVSFFTQSPRSGMTAGGILPAILGSLEVLGLSLLIAFPLGLLTGIYLAEYGNRGRLIRLIGLAITALSGIPSVVYGLFGFSLFCIFLGFRTSLLAGSLTLSLMALPVIACTVKEALIAVPDDIRESAFALGARKTEVIFRVLLPYARTRIITATLLGCGRIIGETAPILLTGAVFFATNLPQSVLDPVMTLPTHIYYLTAAYGENVQWMAKGSSAFLLILVLFIYSIAFRLGRKKPDGKRYVK